MHTIPPAPPKHHTNDRYWRLRALHEYGEYTKGALQRLLEKDGCKVKGLKEDLQNASLRLQCGKTNYESCEDSELRRFVHARKLLTVAAPLQQVINRKVMIDLLKTADDQQTFDKFQDLPPELRERVAKYYLREFSSALIFPTQPPLARASRLLRKEVLPLFYQRCTFELHFERVPGSGIKPCSRTLEWLYSLATDSFASIRNLSFKVGHDAGVCESLSEFCVTMKLGAPLSKDYNLLIVKEKLRRKVNRKSFDRFLQSIVSREGGKFEQNDIYLLRDALEGRIRVTIEDMDA